MGTTGRIARSRSQMWGAAITLPGRGNTVDKNISAAGRDGISTAMWNSLITFSSCCGHALFMEEKCQTNWMLVVLCMYWSAKALSLATATVTVDLLREISLSGDTVNR